MDVVHHSGRKFFPQDYIMTDENTIVSCNSLLEKQMESWSSIMFVTGAIDRFTVWNTLQVFCFKMSLNLQIITAFCYKFIRLCLFTQVLKTKGILKCLERLYEKTLFLKQNCKLFKTRKPRRAQETVFLQTVQTVSAKIELFCRQITCFGKMDDRPLIMH